MAEETLVKEALSADMLAGGSALIQVLEEAGWPIVAAFWLYELENNDWDLVLASPMVAEEGIGAAFERVDEARKTSTPSLSPLQISVVAPDNRTVRAIRALAGQGHKLEGRRVRGTVDRHWVEDSYVYRALPGPPD